MEPSSVSPPTVFSLDALIARFLSARKSKPGTPVAVFSTEAEALCEAAHKVLLSQPALLELEAPVNVCGSINGQFCDLLRVFEFGKFPPESNYLFLGDYADLGPQGLETICLLLAYKVKYPHKVFLLRGEHECASISRVRGFYDECKRRFGTVRQWKQFVSCFDCLPVAALIDVKIFCTHSGISPELESMEQLRKIVRPADIPSCGLESDLIHSIPDMRVQGWAEYSGHPGYRFGKDAVTQFVKRHDLDLVCRSHEMVEEGYAFAADKLMVTIFGAANFKGEFDNSAGFMVIDSSLMCSFCVLKPVCRKATEDESSNEEKKPPS